MNGRSGLFAALIAMGAGWGITMPLAKIAVSEGYRQFGIIFWQMVIGAVLLGLILALRGKSLPLGWRQIWFYTWVALLGTVFPNSASFQAAVYLPAGIISILIAMVPMFAFPIALAMRNEVFDWRRLGGLLCGLLGVLILVGPEASLPERAMVVFIPLALIAPLFYGVEGNLVAKFGTGGADPIQLLCGASLVGIVITLPLALLSGQWINPNTDWAAPEWALIGASVIHALVYSGYVWMVGRAGPVFASLVSYLVTAFGVVWAMILLGETYSHWVWSAMGVMFIGLFLVQPRARGALVTDVPPGQDGPRPQ